MFKQIIVKCVLQLLLIETTHELLQNNDVYNTIPAEHLLRFMGVLDDSWRFARKFNADKDLRMRLWKVGMLSIVLSRSQNLTSAFTTFELGRSQDISQLTLRVHEATSEPVEARVELGRDAHQRLIADVSRS